LSTWLISALVCGTAAHVSAAPVTLRFSGTADLLAFGGSPTSTFAGDVTWDPRMPCNGNGEDYSVCRLDPDEFDGDVPTAHFSVDGADYSQRIAPYSRLEVFPYEFFLELWFVPPIDFDSAGAEDLISVFLVLDSGRHEEPGRPLFPHGMLPDNLAFLSRLERKWFGFHQQDNWYPGVTPTTLHVPEPGVAAMLVAGVVAALGGHTRRRHRPGGFLRR